MIVLLFNYARDHVIYVVRIQRVAHILIVELVSTVMMENAILMVSPDWKDRWSYYILYYPTKMQSLQYANYKSRAFLIPAIIKNYFFFAN